MNGEDEFDITKYLYATSPDDDSEDLPSDDVEFKNSLDNRDNRRQRKAEKRRDSKLRLNLRSKETLKF